MQSYSSYREQAGHYFTRPHVAPAHEPIQTPAAWRGPDVAQRKDWRVRLDDAPGRVRSKWWNSRLIALISAKISA